MARKNKKSSLGPGFLVTAAFIGPGTVTSCSMAGAKFGYALIYALVFAVITTIILQEMTGRLSLGTGKDLGQSLRDYSQNPVAKFLFILLTLFSITLGCAAYEAGNIIGGSLGLEMVTGLSKKIWVVLISLVAIFVLNRKKYKLVERFLVVLVFIMSLSFLTTAIIIQPDIPSIVQGIIPSFPKNSIYLVLALVGTTVVPYNLFLHSSAVKEKWKSKNNLRQVKKDLFLSIGLGGIISASIVITSAVTFFEKGIPLEHGGQLASQLEPLFGPLTNFLFGVGFFAAGLSSAITAPYAAAFASSGVLGWKKSQEHPGFRFIWMGVILTGFLVSLFNFNPLAVIVFAQVANGLLLPVASVFLLLVLNDRVKMGILANSLKQNIYGVAIILIVSFLGIWNIVKLFLNKV